MTLYLNPLDIPARPDPSIALPPKEYAVLTLLLRKRPEAVSKEELIRHAWPGETAVSDDSLVRCVSQLRRHLPHARIEAVYGYGYRLLPWRSDAQDVILEALYGAEGLAETYLHAFELAQKRTLSEMLRAVRLFRLLIRRRPDHVPSRIGLAHTIGLLVGLGVADVAGVATDEAWHELDEVARLAPRARELKAARAWLFDVEWRFDEAERLYRQVLRGGSGSAGLLQCHAWHLSATGRAEHAVAALRAALALRPFAVHTRVILAHSLSLLDEYDAALDEIAHARREYPSNRLAASAEVMLQAAHAPHPGLVSAARRLSGMHELPPYARVCIPYVLARCGRRDEARRELDKSSRRQAWRGLGTRLLAAMAMVELGDLERAAGVIQTAHAARYGWLPMVLRSRQYAPLLEVPAVQAIHRAIFAPPRNSRRR